VKYSYLIRDAVKVKSALTALPSGELLTRKPCRIQVPARYSDVDLAEIGSDTYVYGIYALIMEDQYYAVSNVCAMIQIDPFRVTSEKIDDTDYHIFHFEQDQVLIKNMNVVKQDILIYNVMNEFIFHSRVPWFMEYEDMAKLFDTAKEYADSNIANNLETIELLIAMIGRNARDRMSYYRTIIKNREDLKTNPPVFVPLDSVQYSATNTLNKLAGNYFNDGLVSALTTKTENVEHIEELLRA
jgi:hypothetical protein